MLFEKDSVVVHSKTNRTYRIIGIATDTATGVPVYVYVSDSNQMFVRTVTEMEDGRFKKSTKD